MGTATTLMSTSTFWLSVLLGVVLLLFPVVLCKLYVRETAPTLADRVRTDSQYQCYCQSLVNVIKNKKYSIYITL